ncbi:MAG: hypothetical protein N2422_04895 [Rhodobacteraceae bacterium]|nr:hypothetical protein [Paracoccaceae bacterium]
MSARPPPHPWAVLAVATVLPGMGQVLNREPVRGLVFVSFVVLLGGWTAVTASPDVSVVGRYAGGIFVHAMAMLDAYRRARIRREVWRQGAGRGR